MDTCPNCIHYESCTDWAQLSKTSSIEDSIKGGHYSCEFFKDKSRFVELPCDVGKSLYVITDYITKIGRKKVRKEKVSEVIIDHFTIGDKGIPIATVCDNETNSWIEGVEPEQIYLMYLTPEAAEKALKERNNG